MNEKKFRIYLSKTPSKKGIIPDHNRINSLVKFLKSIIPNKLKKINDGSYRDNLLNIEDISYLEELKKRFNKNGDLNEWDMRKNGKGRGNTSLYHYINFLKRNEMPYKKNNTETNNIILYGSPGVGKTYNTYKLIRLIEDGISDRKIFEIIKNNENSKSVYIDNIEDRIKFVTYHQSFGYEDFIEGFRPNIEGNIELVDGIFKTICKEANKDKEKNYYLVIDEINRGNISKIFGELITLLEEDKRDKLEVTLPYSKKPFKIPSNLYIIGTMNSTDKSIALIDIALRRRFTFLKMKPNAELIEHLEAKRIFISLNQQITKGLGEDYQIGHSYFMGIENDDDLDFVLEYKIKPLLEEYFYGDKDGLGNILKVFEANEDE